MLLRISSENGPSHVQTRILERFAKTVEERAGGRLSVVLHPDARLYRDRDVVAALQRDKVEMALPGIWQFDHSAASTGVLLLPMVYGRPPETMNAALDGPVGKRFVADLEQRLELHVLGRWIPLGPTQIYTIAPALRSPDDLAGLRIRSPGGEANARRLEAFGAKVFTVAWSDLPTALRTQRLDGLISTHATVASERLWEFGLRHALEDREAMSQYVPLVSARFWSRLPRDLRALLTECWEAQVDEARAATAKAQEEARAELIRNGVEIVQPSAADLAAWRGRLLPEQGRWVAEMGLDADLVQALGQALGE